MINEWGVARDAVRGAAASAPVGSLGGGGVTPVGITTAVSMIIVGLVLGFAVTISPSWLSIGLLGTALLVGGLAGLLITVLGRVSRARRERWHAIGPWLMTAGGTVWLAIHEPYVRGIDLVSLGFITAVAGLVMTAVAAFLVSPWRGRGILASWLRPPAAPYQPDRAEYGQQVPYQPQPPYQPYQPYEDDQTIVMRPPEDRSR